MSAEATSGQEVWTCEQFEAIRRRLAVGDRSCTTICRGCSNTSVPAVSAMTAVTAVGE